MIYQVRLYVGDELTLNAILKNMQEVDVCEIVDVVLVSDNNYFIKFKQPIVTAAPWWSFWS